MESAVIFEENVFSLSLKMCQAHTIINSGLSSVGLKHSAVNCLIFNPLTTNDAFWHRQILAACYQLVQSVLEIGSALAG